MAKLKFTKTELKNQQDNKKQFERFLPTLQLKKQQLQLEVRQSADALEANLEAQKELQKSLEVCIAFFGDDDTSKLVSSNVVIKEVITGTANIAGINIPTFDHVEFAPAQIDLMETDWFVDDAVSALKSAASLREAYKVLQEQYDLLSAELRTTSQRANLNLRVGKWIGINTTARTVVLLFGIMAVYRVRRRMDLRGCCWQTEVLRLRDILAVKHR